MLQIKPMADRDREEAILREAEGADDNARVLLMTDGADELGYVTAGFDDKTLMIYEFCVAGKKDFSEVKPDMDTTFILDTLLRSAASFGEVNGADAIHTAFPDFFDFFKVRGFSTDTAVCTAPMSVIVHYE